MNATKLKRLRAAGWKVGSAKDFLKLSDEEAALVELKLSLAGALKQARQKRCLSRVDLAQRDGLEPVSRRQDRGRRPLRDDRSDGPRHSGDRRDPAGTAARVYRRRKGGGLKRAATRQFRNASIS